MNRILFSITKKEFWHIIRDYQTLVIIILMPVMMLLLFGYAVTLEMRQIETILVDQSHTRQSRAFLNDITSTSFFKINDRDVPEKDFEHILQQRKARCIIVIPADFAYSLESKPETKIQVLVDASDPNAANYIRNYLIQISAKFNFKLNPQLKMPFSVEPRILYNPDLKSYYFFVPGLVAVIILLISALLTSIAIVREKEVGTMEQILVSPVHPLQIVIGKVIPYAVIGLIDSILVLIMGRFLFGVPVLGSLWLLLSSLIIYVLAGLSFGLLISTITKSQQVAMMMTLMITLLPTIMLSGFIFPLKSMPVLFQYLSNVVPATHFLIIIRGILLKGSTLMDILPEMGALTGITILLLTISIRKFNTTLE